MDITRFAIEKKTITTVALVVIFMAGLSAYFSLPRSEDPGFLVRTALVSTIFPGASPERVELLVTDKLEKVIQEIPEVDFVKSESRTGVSIVIVNILESENDIRPIWDNLRRKIDKARADLPEGVIGPTVNDEFGDVFGIIYALTGDGYSYAELKEVADQVRNEMLRLRDAGVPLPALAVTLGGWFDLEAPGGSAQDRSTPEPFAHPEFTRARGRDYVGEGGDLRDPFVSPIHADLTGLPPLFLQVGEVDLTRAEACRRAEKAGRSGVDVTLEIHPEMIHGFQGLARAGIPEARAALERAAAYVRSRIRD